MKLSIITINYNNKAGLEKTIESVLSQTWRDFEWIIIDGGSTDGSKEVIESLTTNPLASNLISYWCSEPDKGIYNAMNKGISYANGEFVNFMNSGDCFYDDNTLANVFGFIENRDADIYYGDYIYEHTDGQKILRRVPKNVNLYWLFNHSLNHQSLFTRNSILKKLKFNEEYKVLADKDFAIQAKLAGSSFVKLQNIISCFEGGGESDKNKETWMKEFVDIQTKIVPSFFYRRYLQRIYIYALECIINFKRIF